MAKQSRAAGFRRSTLRSVLRCLVLTASRPVDMTVLPPLSTVIEAGAVGQTVESSWLLPIDTAVGDPCSAVTYTVICGGSGTAHHCRQSSRLMQVAKLGA